MSVPTTREARQARLQDQVLAAVAAEKGRIDALLDRLRAASADHFGVDPEAADYGDLGSLSSARVWLEDAVAMLRA